MEKSYDEDLAKLMSEARDLFKSANFSDSARKYLEAAKNQEATRGLAQAEDLYHEAIKNFIRASEENKEKKQFRMSAQNLYYVSYIYKKLNAREDWIAATKAVVDDLVNAAQEYLMWNEYDRGIILVSTACYFLFSIEDYQAAEELYKKYIEQIQDDPGFTRAQQILYAAGHAIKAVKDSDTTSLLNAQQLVGNHLKPGLSQIMGELFFSAIDSAMDTVVTTFRSKVKLPRIVPELKISRDLVFGESNDLVLSIDNEGEGDAYNLVFKLNIPDGVEVLEGGREITIESLPAKHSTENKLTIQGIPKGTEVTYELSANVTFYDQLQTKQTMMVGPYELVFREKSIIRGYEVELAELAAKGLELKNNLSSVEIMPEKAINLIMGFLEKIIKDSEIMLSNEEFETAYTNINTLEQIHEIMTEISGKEFLEIVYEARDKVIEDKILLAIETVRTEIEAEKAQLTEDHLLETDNLKQSFEEEKSRIQSTAKIQTEKEQKELVDQLEEQHKKELDDLVAEMNKEKEATLEELQVKLDEARKQALQEQETLLRDEFQKLLAEQQGKKRR
ncbi:MAG: hypothetical protein GOP50_05090, partial [Candidatus Heimdallarchaeota archaeon]|nr:hypothetical protein [Candidatus Heimdallarchaeota archaeon]